MVSEIKNKEFSNIFTYKILPYFDVELTGKFKFDPHHWDIEKV